MFEPVLISPIVLGLLILVFIVAAMVARNQTQSARAWRAVSEVVSKRAYQQGIEAEFKRANQPISERENSAYQKGLADAHRVWAKEFDARLQKELSDRACACQTSQDQFEAFEKGAAGA